MNTNLQTQAKEKINELFHFYYSPSEIKNYLEHDDVFCDQFFISKELAEAMYDILSEVRVYDAIVNLFDSDDNCRTQVVISGCNEKEINKTIE